MADRVAIKLELKPGMVEPQFWPPWMEGEVSHT